MIKYGKKKKNKFEGALKKFKEKIQIKKGIILPPNSSRSKKIIIKDEDGSDSNNQKQETIDDNIKEAIKNKINTMDLEGVKIYYGRSIWMNRLAQVSIILQKHILEIIKQEKTSWSELTKTSLKNFLSSSQNSEKSTMEEINEKTIFDIYTKKVNESNSERFGNEMFLKKGKNNKKGLGFITPQASPMRVFNSLGCKDVGECSSKNNEQKRYSFSFASPIKSFVASPRRFFSQKKDSFSKSGKRYFLLKYWK
uniref:Uncharacterized protein n=1 Tax=Meloidogyne incognita TaxID=6306 RepID=A0A914LVS8_MELIC